MGAATRVAGRRRARQSASKVGRLWLPVRGFAGIDNNGTSDLTLSQGTPSLEPASGNAELAVMPMTTADEVHTIIPVPWDMDICTDLAARIFFIHAAAAADTSISWKLGYLFLAKLAGVPEIKGGVDKDVTFASYTTSSTDDSLEVTPWTNLETATYQTPADVMLALALELDSDGDAEGDECELVGVELAYQRNPAAQSFKTIAAFVRENPV